MAFTGSNWGRRVKLTGLTPSATLSGFVALVSLDNVPVEAIDAGSNSALNGGGDLRFSTDDAGVNQLPLEVVSFVTNATLGNRSCQLWIRFPTYASGTREVYMFYNKVGEVQPAVTASFGRNAVWQDLELVIHQGTVIDSTGNHTPSLVGAPSLTSGLWGGNGFDLNSNSKYIQIPHDISLNIERNYAVDLWFINSDVFSGSDPATFVDKVDAGNSQGFRLLSFPIGQVRVRQPNLNSSNLNNTNISLSTGGNFRVGSNFDGTTRQAIINVNYSADTPTGVVTNTTEDLYIGRALSGTNNFFKGVLGDFRLKKSSISTDERDSEYNNQNSPSTFWATGAPDTPAGGGISVTVDSGIYLYTGTDVSLITSRILTVDSGTYNYTGTSVNLVRGLVLNADTGNYTYTGADATLTFTPAGTFILTAESGVYTYTGTDINFNRDRVIIASSGTYTYSGTNIQVILPGQIWTDKPTVSTTWTNQAQTITIWTDK